MPPLTFLPSRPGLVFLALLAPLAAQADPAAAPANEPLPLLTVQWVIVLSPLLMHLLMLYWLWRSNMTLEGALADKETINKEGERARLLRTAVVQQVLKPQANTPPAQGQDAALAALAQQNQTSDNTLRKAVATDAFTQPLANTDTQPKPATSDSAMTNEGDASPPASEAPKPITSVSRLIVFMSGYAGVSIGISLASYGIYHAFAYPDKDIPSFDGLVTVLLSLGIGVLPYGFNKIAAATGSKTA
jgi:hypothetical protein